MKTGYIVQSSFKDGRGAKTPSGENKLWKKGELYTGSAEVKVLKALVLDGLIGKGIADEPDLEDGYALDTGEDINLHGEEAQKGKRK